MANITPAMPQLQDDDDEIDAVVVDHGDDRCFRTRGIFLQLQSAVVIIRLLVLLHIVSVGGVCNYGFWVRIH